MAIDIQGRDDAPALLLSNSLAADMDMWAGQASALASEFRVVRFDARGHGATAPTSGDYSIESLSRDVIGLLDGIGIERVHFVGLSLGGMIGQWLGANAPERLESLTLCATTNGTSRELWQRRIDAVEQSGLETIVEATLERWLTPRYRADHADGTDSVRQMIRRTSIDGYRGCAAAIRDMDIAGCASEIRMPTLVLAAEHDPSSPPAEMRKLHESI
eukprot:gene4754-6482_t